MNKDKVYIFNFWESYNYGAVLTAYALQQVIKSLGYESVLINDILNPSRFTTKKDSFNKIFAQTYLSCVNVPPKTSAYINELKNGKIFITGSDQVFRTALISNKGRIQEYLLDFIPIDAKKISFAASFGVNKEKFLNETSSKIVEYMKSPLKSFDYISVRENSGLEICKDVFNINAEWIIDPVFIINKSKHDDLIKNSTEDYNNKIVSYVLDTNKDYDKAYKYFEKKYNTKVIKTVNSNISIENWLASIKNCKFLITDSFHGMCFAIIFNKPFICLANKNRGATRFESILNMLGIEYQCINDINEIYKKDCIFKLDYEKVNQRILEEAQKGLKFLKNALDAPVSKKDEKVEAKLQFLEDKIKELETKVSIKYQIKQGLWNLWLVIFHKYLPNQIKNTIRVIKNKLKKGKY